MWNYVLFSCFLKHSLAEFGIVLLSVIFYFLVYYAADMDVM